MKIIVFQPMLCSFSKFGYGSSIRIGYLLNGYLVAAGIQQQEYKLTEDLQKFYVENKLKILIDAYDDEAAKKTAIDCQKMMELINKTKHKSAKMIVTLAHLKKQINKIFDEYTANQYVALDKMLGLKVMKDLMHPNHFYFYHMPGNVSQYDNQTETTTVEIMQLLLPDPEKENPIFFINLHKESFDHVELQIHAPENALAENPGNLYGEQGFIFPMMSNMSSNEIFEARNQMEMPTREFRQKIDQWATICYQNRGSNAGLEFFRESLTEFLSTLKDSALESPILKSVSRLTRQKSQTQIIIGEAPVEKIWRIYRDNEAISEEEYNELINIKTEQFPKYEGRWPVMFLTILQDDINAPSDGEFQSARKSILVD